MLPYGLKPADTKPKIVHDSVYISAAEQQKESKMEQKTSDDLLKAYEAAKAAEEAEAAKAANDTALYERMNREAALAACTCNLIDEAYQLVRHGGAVAPNKRFATFRKELSPLAESWGVKIVLVGDKTTATLVLV